MAKTIEGVPETITRAQYLSLIEAVGFDVDNLVELRFAAHGIHATVRALDDDGHILLDRAHNEMATHSIYVRVVES